MERNSRSKAPRLSPLYERLSGTTITTYGHEYVPHEKFRTDRLAADLRQRGLLTHVAPLRLVNPGWPPGNVCPRGDFENLGVSVPPWNTLVDRMRSQDADGQLRKHLGALDGLFKKAYAEVVEYYQDPSHYGPGAEGATCAHILAWEAARTYSKPTLILESDASLTPDFMYQAERALEEAMVKDPSLDLLWLATNACGKPKGAWDPTPCTPLHGPHPLDPAPRTPVQQPPSMPTLRADPPWDPLQGIPSMGLPPPPSRYR